MGVPPSSENCLEAASFFPFASEAGLMRVPRPAAGIMATTFIAGCKDTRRCGRGQISALPLAAAPPPAADTSDPLTLSDLAPALFSRVFTLRYFARFGNFFLRQRVQTDAEPRAHWVAKLSPTRLMQPGQRVGPAARPRIGPRNARSQIARFMWRRR